MQELIVALIVACAVFAVGKRYLPVALRKALRRKFARLARSLGWQALARKIESKSTSQQGCASGCDTCGSCGPTPAKPTGRHTIMMKKL